MRRFCANVSLLFGELPLLDRFAAARAAGFGAVEMHWHRDVEPGDVRAAIADASLQLVLLNFDGGDTAGGDRGLAADPGRCSEFLDNVPVALELAAAVGCTRLNALVGKRIESMPLDDQLALARDNLTVAADAAAGHGAVVLIEALNRHDTPGCLIAGSDAAAELARAVGRPNMRLQFDAYHMDRMAEDLTASIELHRGQIAHVQLADNPGRGDPGTGEIDFDAVFGALHSIGYDGWIGLEYVPPEGDTPASLQRLRARGLL